MNKKYFTALFAAAAFVTLAGCSSPTVITLKDGSIIAGRYAEKSFASSAPASEQIYLEETWVLNDNGGFERAKNNTAGVIILSDEISHVELRN